VFESIRPLVLPKLREENERALAKKKSKPVKDVLVEDDFEVSIFLRESGTRHSVVTKQKIFENQPQEVTSADKLTDMSDSPIHILDEPEPGPTVLVESDEEPQVNLKDIPDAAGDTEDNRLSRRRGRRRGTSGEASDDGSHPSKRKKADLSSARLITEDEKKLGFDTVYEGFSIWGWVLCLLITRKVGKPRDGKATVVLTGPALMEEWISTQALQDYDD
jgi:hypothetical protein